MRKKLHPDAKLTVTECYHKFYDKENLAPKTMKAFIYYLANWERLTGSPAIGDVTDETAEKFRAGMLAEGRVAMTVNSQWGAVRAVLRLMAHRFHGNPRGRGVIENVAYMKHCPVVRKRPRRISMDDLNRAYVAAEFATHPRIGVPAPDWWRALLVVGYTTGLRKTDLMSLKREQIDLEAGTLTFSASKTQKDDVFPLHPVANLHLRTIWNPERSRVFRGGPVAGSYLYRLWHNILDRGEVPRFTFHDLRRTGASEIERVKPGMASVFLQHAPRSVTTRHYLNVTEELREAIHAMRLPETFSCGPRLAGEINGRLREIRLQAAAEYMSPPPRGNAPEDWEFMAGQFAYQGQWRRLTGQSLLMLRALALSPTPLDVRQIAFAVYGPEIDAELQSYHDRIKIIACQLRKILRDAFAFPDHWDACPCVDRTGPSWTIATPPAELMGGVA